LNLKSIQHGRLPLDIGTGEHMLAGMNNQKYGASQAKQNPG
jgi:hypothetical protein